LAAAIAVALVGSLGLSSRTEAGSYLNLVTIQNIGVQSGYTLDVTFGNTDGSVANLAWDGALDPFTHSYVSTPGVSIGTPNYAAGMTNVAITFNQAIPSSSFLLMFQFSSDNSGITLGPINWIEPAAPDPPGGGSIGTFATTPEPGSMVLLGIGAAGLLAGRRLARRRAL